MSVDFNCTRAWLQWAIGAHQQFFFQDNIRQDDHQHLCQCDPSQQLDQSVSASVTEANSGIEWASIGISWLWDCSWSRSTSRSLFLVGSLVLSLLLRQCLPFLYLVIFWVLLSWVWCKFCRQKKLWQISHSWLLHIWNPASCIACHSFLCTACLHFA